MSPTLSRTFASLRSRNVRWFLFGNAPSMVGTWAQMTALPWLVLKLTGSGTALGLTSAALFVPVLVLGAFAGVVADRVDKRHLLIGLSAILMVLSGALAVLTITGTVTLGLVIAFCLLTGTVTAFDNAGRRAYLPELVPPGEITNIVGLNNAFFTISRILGPAIAGMLIAGFGIGWTFAINSISFVSALISLAMIRRKDVRTSTPIERARGQLRAGLAYVWRDHTMRLTFLMLVVIGTLSFNFQVILPLLAKRTFGAGAGAYAAMFAIVSAGSFFGALFSANRVRASVRVMIAGAIGMGVTMALVAATPTLWLAYVALVPMGTFNMVFFSMSSSVVQERTTPSFRGRVNALYLVAFVGTTPIGSPLIGWISQEWGARVGLLVGAVAAFGMGLVAMAVVRRWTARVAASATVDTAMPVDATAQPAQPAQPAPPVPGPTVAPSSAA